ncbi:MAG: porphobilinogen synthase [Phycisphaera sp.]|nr:porphobilinogen synthase [Phycisphaera sp.]
MSESDTPYRPVERPRRLRRGQLMRDMVADVRVTADHLVMPLFVRHGEGLRKPIASMPGVEQMSPDVAVDVIGEQCARGLRRFILFGVIDASAKDATGSAAVDVDNPVNVTLKRVRDAGHDALMIADLCFCEYTDHGHCGALCDDAALTVDNDATLDMLGEQAMVLADCGADIVAPSGMMDGQVAAIREALDDAGHDHIAIMSYAVKYASSMYGPFRDAGEGTPQFGDRRGYQMDYRRSREWMTELELDLDEGADIVMVKPAATYLDVIRGVRDACDAPVAAYHVSGEFSMIHAAAANGWIDLRAGAVEVTTAIKRAGADVILTYFAPQLIDWL